VSANPALPATRIGELFATAVAEKIEPVIKVGEVSDEGKLAGEIGSYVVTPMIEKYLEQFLDHFTDTIRSDSTEIGVWISGYFGSGKSHLAKIMAMLCENRSLTGVTACERFQARLMPDADHRASILRSLGLMTACQTRVLAFNLNTLSDSKNRPLPALLLSQYYQSRGYGNNLVYARVIEAELDRRGKLADLHREVETRARKTWAQIQSNLAFYRKPLFEAAAAVAPDVFGSAADVERAMREAESGEAYNVHFLIDTILEDLKRTQEQQHKPARLLLVLDESGQWIGNDSQRLSQLQALIEEAAIKGKGSIWIFVTTHSDMGSIYKEARILEGDLKKIEGRFRFRFGLTTENIELVLENRLFRKNDAGRRQLTELYQARSGAIRDLGELSANGITLPACTEERFAAYYPFFPYQVKLIPEIVKSLRTKGGHGEQMTGSTRTLLAITQDILRAGRRRYLDGSIGMTISFDEVYANLAGEAEVNPNVRTEIAKISSHVTGGSDLTRRVAEILFMIRELPGIVRSKETLARFLVEDLGTDLGTLATAVETELQRLAKAKMVSRIGEEWEFLTGERRTFEEEVSTREQQFKVQDRERGLAKHFVTTAGENPWRLWLDLDTVRYQGAEFRLRLAIDDTPVPRTEGHVTLHIITPLGVITAGRSVVEVEARSQHADQQATITVVCQRSSAFDQELDRFLAMREVIDNWKGDTFKSEDAKRLAMDRERDDMPKLLKRVHTLLHQGLANGQVVFRGFSRAVPFRQGQPAVECLRTAIEEQWPKIYPRFDQMPVRVVNDQRVITEALDGNGASPSAELKALRILDRTGKPEAGSPLLDTLRARIAAEQTAGRRVSGRDLLDHFTAPPFGWDGNAIRAACAALVRGGALKVQQGGRQYANPADQDLRKFLLDSRQFPKVDLLLEEADLTPELLESARGLLVRLTRRRGIDETPAAIAEVAGTLAADLLSKAERVTMWAQAIGLPLGATCTDGIRAWQDVAAQTAPIQRVRLVTDQAGPLEAGHTAILTAHDFNARNAEPFREMQESVRDAQAVSHLLPAGGQLGLFIAEFVAAVRAGTIVDQPTWKSLGIRWQSAAIERKELLSRWRSDAQAALDAARARLPQDCADRGLDTAVATQAAADLEPCAALVAQAQTLGASAALANQIDVAVRRVAERIAAAVQAKVAPKPPTGGSTPPPPPNRKVQQLRPRDVDTVTRIGSMDDWERFKTKLDTRVRDALDNGYDVELS